MTDLKLRKGMIFIHKETGNKLTYGKKNPDGTLWCITHDKNFLTISIDDLLNQYKSASEIEKTAKERRKRQAW